MLVGGVPRDRVLVPHDRLALSALNVMEAFLSAVGAKVTAGRPWRRLTDAPGASLVTGAGTEQTFNLRIGEPEQIIDRAKPLVWLDNFSDRGPILEFEGQMVSDFMDGGTRYVNVGALHLVVGTVGVATIPATGGADETFKLMGGLAALFNPKRAFAGGSEALIHTEFDVLLWDIGGQAKVLVEDATLERLLFRLDTLVLTDEGPRLQEGLAEPVYQRQATLEIELMAGTVEEFSLEEL